jgi:hypothetical protein
LTEIRDRMDGEKGGKKREKGGKRDRKKDGQYAFIRSMQDRFKCDVKIDGKKEKKGRKKGRRKGGRR